MREFLLFSFCLQRPNSAIIDEIGSYFDRSSIVVYRHQVQVQYKLRHRYVCVLVLFYFLDIIPSSGGFVIMRIYFTPCPERHLPL